MNGEQIFRYGWWILILHVLQRELNLDNDRDLPPRRYNESWVQSHNTEILLDPDPPRSVDLDDNPGPPRQDRLSPHPPARYNTPLRQGTPGTPYPEERPDGVIYEGVIDFLK